jgi:magnesium-protoporphyrin IX monomethyl ester (oxidative) cyclase
VSPSAFLQFNQHVIIETNKTTERIFPAVPDVEHPEFFNKMDELVKLNNKVREGGGRT